MENSRIIWRHEADEADSVARTLVNRDRPSHGGRSFFPPAVIAGFVRSRGKIKLTRQNLLYTKQLAFDAAKEISRGNDRVKQLGIVDLKTRETLRTEAGGFYTEKIRKRQLKEIDLLVDHYLELLNSGGKTYDDMVRAAYQSREQFEAFLVDLSKRENDVIEAAVSTMRKGSKSERVSWFRTVREVTRAVRSEELTRIFGEPCHSSN